MSERDPQVSGPVGDDRLGAAVGAEHQWDPSGEEVHRILRERARELARPLETPDTSVELLDILIFTASAERYGIEIRYVLDVGRLHDLALLPGAPPFVRGIIHHRGRALPVFDVRRLLDLMSQDIAGDLYVIAVETAGMAFGIVTDLVEGVLPVSARDLTPATASGLRNPWFMGVTSDTVVVLDLEALAQDPRILVKDVAS